MTAAGTPRNYPQTMASPETGRRMVRGDKLVSLTVDGHRFEYRQPGWWCSLDDPADLDGQVVVDDTLCGRNGTTNGCRRSSGAEAFPPLLIRAIRLRCGLSQRAAGDLFGTGEKSFEKYEAGQSASKPTQRLLRLAMTRPDLFSKRRRGDFTGPAMADIRLVQDTIKAARLDRIYATLFDATTAPIPRRTAPRTM